MYLLPCSVRSGAPVLLLPRLSFASCFLEASNLFLVSVPPCLHIWIFSHPVKVGKYPQAGNGLRHKPPTSTVGSNIVISMEMSWGKPRDACSSSHLFDIILISWLYHASPSISECPILPLKRSLNPHIVNEEIYTSCQLLYYGLRRFSSVEGACNVSKSESNVENSG